MYIEHWKTQINMQIDQNRMNEMSVRKQIKGN
jgi:hypothetical protein